VEQFSFGIEPDTSREVNSKISSQPLGQLQIGCIETY